MTEKIKVIMDCDPGIDDALAMAYVAASQDVLELLAITSVSGNQSIEKVTRNALDLAEFYGLDVPVAEGAHEPLVREPQFAGEVHGSTGLGNCVLPKAERQLEKENAVLFLHKILSGLPKGEQAVLVPTGPLTNIALLLKTFPEIKSRIREIVFMGGAAKGGNVTPAAEFNIYADPEAAQIVCKSGVPLVMCGLDVTTQCFLTKNQIAKLCQSNNEVAKVCGDMAGFYISQPYNKYKGTVNVHDAVPFMYLVHPEFFSGEKAKISTDCSEGVSRGSTLCDFRWWNYEEEEMNALVLNKADTEQFQQHLISAIYELGEARKS